VDVVTPNAGAAVMKQFSSLGMSSRPTSAHVQPRGRIEKPGPDVTVAVVVEETVLTYMPEQIYR
jgi:hypothetical protein